MFASLATRQHNFRLLQKPRLRQVQTKPQVFHRLATRSGSGSEGET